MANNHLEQLISEWYQHNGYVVRAGHRVGKRPNGGYAGEIDIAAFHPSTRHLVHVEAGQGSESWAELDTLYARKFAIGRAHIRSLFDGFENLPTEPECIAVLVVASDRNRNVVGGGKMIPLRKLLRQIVEAIGSKPFERDAIPEQFPLLRMLQMTCTYRKHIFSEVESAPSRQS